MSLHPSQRAGRIGPGGFTLVELIVVLVIVAATAGIVIPAVSQLGRSTDMATSAANQRELGGSIQQYFTLQKRFPQGLDSLLQYNTTGDVPAAADDPNSLYVNVSSAGVQVSGMTTSSPNLLACLELLDLSTLPVDPAGTNQYSRSLTRGGFDYVFDHRSYAPATGLGERNASESASIRRSLTSPSTGTPNPENWVASVKATGLTSGNIDILRRIVPGDFDATGTYTPETGTRLVAFGIGGRCQLIPTAMMSAPLYNGCDGSYYGRYVAIFKVFNTGERPVLVGIVDAYGRTLDYTQQQFNESLPNNARQG